MPDVILVDESDRFLGVESKLSAHQNGGKLHRAFSVFIMNAGGGMLLQRRSHAKYHFGGLWTNACCSHPRRGENVVAAARQRLLEEFGFTSDLREIFSFTYRAEDPFSGLAEYEFDHVLIGRFDGVPRPDPGEIEAWRWVARDPLMHEISNSPDLFTPWFRLAAARVYEAAEISRC